MPVEVKAWRCRYRCGRRATTQLASITKHEQFCLYDPKHRTCLSCEHNGRVPADETMGGYFECAVNAEIPEGKQCAIGCIKHKINARYQAKAAQAAEGE